MATKEELEAKIFDFVGYSFNILSAKQLAKALYEDVGLPIKDRTSAGNPSTSEEALKKLAGTFEIAKDILEYKRLIKSGATTTDIPTSQESTEVYVANNVSSATEIPTIKTPKPGMPQPRQVLDTDPNAELADLFNKDTSEILKEEEQKSTSVFVARDVPIDDLEKAIDAMEDPIPEDSSPMNSNSAAFSAYTSYEEETATSSSPYVTENTEPTAFNYASNQENTSASQDFNAYTSSSSTENDSAAVQQTEPESSQKSISTSSTFNLSEEQRNNFSIIKNKDKAAEKNTPQKKSSFSFDDVSKENEFSQNSMVMNVKQEKSKPAVEKKVSILKNRLFLSLIAIFVLIFIVIIGIVINSINSIN